MKLIYFLYLIFSVALLIGTGYLGRQYAGWFGEAFVVLFFLILLGIFILGRGMYNTLCVVDRLLPIMPRCESGCCRYKDYTFETIMEKTDRDFTLDFSLSDEKTLFRPEDYYTEASIVTCKCGHKYIMRKNDMFFKKLNADGSESSYMISNWMGLWKKDKSKD